MILELTYWLTMITQSFIFFFFWNQMLPQRFRHTYLIGVPYTILSHILILFCYEHMVLYYALQSFLKLTATLLGVCVLYKGSIKKKMGIWLLTECAALLCTLPVEFLLSSLYGVKIDHIQMNRNDTIGGMILLNNILLVVSILVGLLCKRKKLIRNEQLKQTMIMLCFVLVHFGFSCLQFSDRTVIQRDLNCFVHAAFQIMLFVLVYVQYSTTLQNWEIAKQTQELEHIRLQQDYIYNYYLLAQQRFQDVAALRRDMKNLMQTMQELHSDSGTHCDLNPDFSETLGSIPEQHFCSIPVIDAVLRLKSQEAAQYGIQTEFHPDDFSDALTYSDSDLCSAFANLLDNAIRSCRNDKNLDVHTISLRCFSENNRLTLTVTNSYGWEDFPHLIRQNDDTNPIGHGHGLKIVENIAKKYSGSFVIQRQAQTVTAELRLSEIHQEGTAAHV